MNDPINRRAFIGSAAAAVGIGATGQAIASAAPAKGKPAAFHYTDSSPYAEDAQPVQDRIAVLLFALHQACDQWYFEVHKDCNGCDQCSRAFMLSELANTYGHTYQGDLCLSCDPDKAAEQLAPVLDRIIRQRPKVKLEKSLLT